MGGRVKELRRIGSRRDVSGGGGRESRRIGSRRDVSGGGGYGAQKYRLQEGYEWWEF